MQICNWIACHIDDNTAPRRQADKGRVVVTEIRHRHRKGITPVPGCSRDLIPALSSWSTLYDIEDVHLSLRVRSVDERDVEIH